jgi:two-component system cell cycle response regulator
VADSDPSRLEQVHQQLVAAGHRVQLAQTGSEVVYACEVDPPDVLVLDANLPDMDGFEVCERVRRETRESDLAVIFVTDAATDLERTYLGQMVEFAGGDYFLTKPCDSRLLLQLIEDLVAANCDNAVAGSRPRSLTRVVWPTARTPMPTA